MKIRFSSLTFLGAAFFMLALIGLVWVGLFRDSIAYAVPAGAQHIHGVAHSSPDAVAEDPSTDNYVSVAFMTRGYCYAGSQEDAKALGGFGPSANAAQRVQTPYSGKGLFLLAQPGVVMPFAGRPGMRVTLINNSRELLAFSASDSRLAVVQEAQDTDGKWKPLEYLPSSDCGNSYHRVFLGPGMFWAFAAPRYKGTVPTKLRFAVVLADGSQLYSNAFDGSVNPEQFTVKQGHRATDLMDPASE